MNFMKAHEFVFGIKCRKIAYLLKFFIKIKFKIHNIVISAENIYLLSKPYKQVPLLKTNIN